MPKNLSGRRIALEQLQEIQTIRVSRRKTSGFEVEVLRTYPLSDTTSRIPSVITISSRSVCQNSNELSTVLIERELHEFISLRDSVYNIVHYAHRQRHCDFCAKMTGRSSAITRTTTSSRWDFSLRNFSPVVAIARCLSLASC
ncbi:hypothetical protein PHMEG_00041777 [Phytophthora megakarya]|uniref:Uncharacterized protein n=1 Tax=Phytophthora megakarya TaxID=4795 RepID=A0A225UC55_9STRA|nr:hypothetical protein PHMEG_00041777 [Phytophthora megakarya]